MAQNVADNHRGAAVVSGNENMWRWEEDGKRGYNGEHCEETEAHPVDHHRRELPVTALVLKALIVTQFRRDGSQLSEDALQQADGRCAAAAAAAWNAVRHANRRLAAVDESSGCRRRVRAEANWRAMTTAGTRPTVDPSTVATHPVVVERPANTAATTALKHPVIVLEVKDVCKQTLGRPLAQLYFAYFATLLSRWSTAVLDVITRTLHAQQPRQVLAHTFPYLQQQVSK